MQGRFCAATRCYRRVAAGLVTAGSTLKRALGLEPSAGGSNPLAPTIFRQSGCNELATDFRKGTCRGVLSLSGLPVTLETSQPQLSRISRDWGRATPACGSPVPLAPDVRVPVAAGVPGRSKMRARV
jgi:hypothetical protein